MSERRMSKRAQTGVGQLVLQIAFPEGDASNAAGETEDNGSPASIAPSAIRSKPERKHKWYSLIDKVYALSNLWAAWQHVKANNGASGIDRQTVDRFDAGALERVESLAADLKSKIYRPQPVRRVYISQSGGGERPRGVPPGRGRVGQEGGVQGLGTDLLGKIRKNHHRV